MLRQTRRLTALWIAGALSVASCSLIYEYGEVPAGPGGGGGNGGGGQPCTTVAECPPSTACGKAVCEDGLCGQLPEADGTPCTAGLGAGECQDGICLVECNGANAEMVCDDEEDCTDDICDVGSGTCAHDAIPDQPHPTLTQVVGDCRIILCVAGVTVPDRVDDTDVPDDGNSCTADTCDGGTPSHVPVAEGTPCGEGNKLSCDDAGICVGCNDASDCDGQDTTCRWRACEDEICGFGNAGDGTPCDDGVFCNGSDSCNGNGQCAQHAGDPCDGTDSDGDCSETCREIPDDCAGNDPNGSVCSDGLFCNGGDRCQNGSCSQHLGDPCVGADGDGDCSESCNEQNNNCTANDPNNSVCSDGLFCNGGDRCENGSCSQHLGDPCVGADGDGDCSESCNEQNNNCTANDPTGASCDDGTPCNGADTCQNGSCSGHAGNPCPGDDVGPNCADSCDPSTGTCDADDAKGTPCGTLMQCSGGYCVAVG